MSNKTHYSTLHRMTITVVGLISLVIGSAAHSTTWTATCIDGKNIQYNQTMNGNGFLYMKVIDSRGRMHIWQIAKLKQTFYNGTAICGRVMSNSRGNKATGGHPITQLCANKSRQTIYVKYKHPYEEKPFESGEFCSAKVIIR